jgi:hypothetical protein
MGLLATLGLEPTAAMRMGGGAPKPAPTAALRAAALPDQWAAPADDQVHRDTPFGRISHWANATGTAALLDETLAAVAATKAEQQKLARWSKGVIYSIDKLAPGPQTVAAITALVHELASVDAKQSANMAGMSDELSRALKTNLEHMKSSLDSALGDLRRAKEELAALKDEHTAVRLRALEKAHNDHIDAGLTLFTEGIGLASTLAGGKPEEVKMKLVDLSAKLLAWMLKVDYESQASELQEMARSRRLNSAETSAADAATTIRSLQKALREFRTLASDVARRNEALIGDADTEFDRGSEGRLSLRAYVQAIGIAGEAIKAAEGVMHAAEAAERTGRHFARAIGAQPDHFADPRGAAAVAAAISDAQQAALIAAQDEAARAQEHRDLWLALLAAGRTAVASAPGRRVAAAY